RPDRLPLRPERRADRLPRQLRGRPRRPAGAGRVAWPGAGLRPHPARSGAALLHRRRRRRLRQRDRRQARRGRVRLRQRPAGDVPARAAAEGARLLRLREHHVRRPGLRLVRRPHRLLGPHRGGPRDRAAGRGRRRDPGPGDPRAAPRGGRGLGPVPGPRERRRRRGGRCRGGRGRDEHRGPRRRRGRAPPAGRSPGRCAEAPAPARRLTPPGRSATGRPVSTARERAIRPVPSSPPCSAEIPHRHAQPGPPTPAVLGRRPATAVDAVLAAHTSPGRHRRRPPARAVPCGAVPRRPSMSATSPSAGAVAPSADRGAFSRRTAFIFAAIGSAVGLGNIWRFPAVAYENGGGAFILPYLVALLTAGIPLLFLDYAIGHRWRGSAPAAWRRFRRWTEFIGWWQVLIALI